MIPILNITAEAGAGKDTFGSYVAEQLGGTCIGFADPLKAMCGAIWPFTDEQLFGDSKFRNAIDIRFNDVEVIETARNAMRQFGPQWIQNLGLGHVARLAFELLETWFDNCVAETGRAGGLSPRFALQTLGTEWGRALNPKVWIDRAWNNGIALLCGGYRYQRRTGLVADASQKPYSSVYITDGRFANEAIESRARGGGAVKVKRPKKENTATTGVAQHASEAIDSIPDHFFDAVVINDAGLDDFRELAFKIAGALIGVRRTDPLSHYASDIAAQKKLFETSSIKIGAPL